MRVDGFLKQIISLIAPVPQVRVQSVALWPRSNLISFLSLRAAVFWRRLHLRCKHRRSNLLLCVITVSAILSLTACSSTATPQAATTFAIEQSSATPAEPRLSSKPSAMPSLPPAPTSTPTYRLTLEAVGDIMLARTVGDQVLENGPQVVFAGVRSILDSADIRVGNLECAITERETPEKKSFPLKAPLQTVKALALAKFDLLSLANNHAMDYGYTGLMDTKKALDQFGILTVGSGADYTAAHTPILIERNGLRLAFLAYADVMPENSGFDAHTWIATDTRPGIAWADPGQIKADVSAARLKADLVVVLLHSGYEINSAVSTSQRLEAQTAIDAGAALVLGSHPHLLQPIQQYHGGLIAYSLGNFVFDQYKGIEDASIILRVKLDRSGFLSYDYVPVLIENGLPVLTSIDNVRGIQTLVAPLSP
jgi:poly-gamma-glutamate capsule biosynthesis protein CapA/YwtB (metallophosphatase superfamily)